VAALLSGLGVQEAEPDLPSNSNSGLPDSYRLLRKDGFAHIIRAEAVLDGYFKVFFVKNEKDHARLGIVASKKVLPFAVQRNHIKRAVREIFRHHSIKTCNLDLVVMVRSFDAYQGAKQNQNLNLLLNRIQNRCAMQ
jgi:ribonuclease P protein component